MTKVYVAMTDKFMSGWGMARGMTNRYVIECDDWSQAEAIEKAAHKRSEMKRIAICLNKPKARPSVLITMKKFSDLSGPWLEFYKAAEQSTATA